MRGTASISMSRARGLRGAGYVPLTMRNTSMTKLLQITKDLVFTEISASNSYVALLETFTEARKLVPDYRPHSSLSLDLDDGRYGPAPGAWDVRAAACHMKNSLHFTGTSC